MLSLMEPAGPARLITATAAQLVLLLLSGRPASASPGDEATSLGAGALPSIVRVGLAGQLPEGATLAASAGYGFTEGVLGTGDTHHRAAGALAVSLRLAPWVAVAARFDGRYDAHRAGPNGSDDGWVGDPRLTARATTAIRRGPWLGGQIELWAPGATAPSIVPGALSLDVSALAAWSVSPLVLAATAGFRLDNSAASLKNRDRLSPADRLSWGASDSNAVLVGAGASLRVRPDLELLAEASWDVLVGSASPGPLASPLRFDLGARWSPSRRWILLGSIEASPSRRPAVGRGEPLVPIEPLLRVMATLVWRVGAGAVVVTSPPPPPSTPAPIPAPTRPTPPAPASLRGRVVTLSGVPIASARVTVTPAGADTPIDVATDAEGNFAVARLEAGRTTLRFSAEGYRVQEQTLELSPGSERNVEQVLERALPAGQIRGVISAFGGSALAATITVQPLGVTATTDAEGGFQIDVPPGSYVVVVEASGYRSQRRRLRVEENGVTVLNADLQTEARP